MGYSCYPFWAGGERGSFFPADSNTGVSGSAGGGGNTHNFWSWSNVTNHPSNLITPHPFERATHLAATHPDRPSAMRISIDSLTSINTSIGHSSPSIHSSVGVGSVGGRGGSEGVGYITPKLVNTNTSIPTDSFLYNNCDAYNKLVNDYINKCGPQLLKLPEESVLDRINNLNILQPTKIDPNTLFEKPELLLNVINSLTKSSNSPSTSLTINSPSTSSTINTTTPITMEQIDLDLTHYVNDNVINFVEKINNFF